MKVRTSFEALMVSQWSLVEGMWYLLVLLEVKAAFPLSSSPSSSFTMQCGNGWINLFTEDAWRVEINLQPKQEESHGLFLQVVLASSDDLFVE